MLPLSFDIRSYYRKHQTGATVNEDGTVEPTYSTSGPYSLAFRPGGDRRNLTEQGYSYEETEYLVIADNCSEFEEGDVLTDGENDLYSVSSVQTWPTEQLMRVRGL